MQSEAYKQLNNPTETAEFLKTLNIFLNRLIDDPADKARSEFKEKTRRQLLCSIGIDLKSDNVPAEEYFSIFRSIDLENSNIEAHRLFYNTACNKHFTNSFKKKANNFRIMVCPVKDWKYYLDTTDIGLYGSDQELHAPHVIVSAINSKQNIRLKTTLLHKGSDKSYFWLCSEYEFRTVRTLKGLKGIIDALGLSHLNFGDELVKDFFYIDLAGIQLETFKPNATLVNWSDPYVGFISKKGRTGRTFSITGGRPSGMNEKVFNKKQLDEKERQQVVIAMLSTHLDSPPNINCKAVVTEGLKRFTKI
jgi:hypothetical protein